MVNAQDWLDTNYPKEGRDNVDNLNISSKNLEEKLVIEDFVNLEELDCSRNQLTELELNNLPKLKKFWGHTCQMTSLIVKNCPEIAFFTIAENLLESFDFTSLSPEKLISTLSVRDNNFPEQDLSCFSKFTKLEQLYVGNLNEKKIRKGVYNRFYGSLKTLKELKKLREINIGSTDIEKGLKYLPNNLEWIFCGNYIKNAKCLKIREKLKDFLKNEQHGGTYDYQEWKKVKAKWKEGGFSDLEIKQWTKAGLKLRELGYANYLKQKVQNFANVDPEELMSIHNQAQNYLNFNYPLESREEIIKLDISGKDLEGIPNLEDFMNLEELDYSNNKFTSNEFLRRIPNKEKLKKLKLNNNKVKENLVFLVPFTKLVELNIANCPLFGSLEPLKDMKELQVVHIGGTNIEGELEYLSENCQKIYCNESELVKEISSKYLKEDSEGKYYELFKWREDKQNSIALVIPLERLFVIRGNIRQFLKKWGTRTDTNPSELSKLKSPSELWRLRWAIYGTQFIGRGSAVAGAILIFQDSQTVGGGIAAVYPITELVVSKLEESLKNKENKWKEFLIDADTFSDNYNELLGILSQFEIDETKKGKVNKALKNLDENSKGFLNLYDENKDKEIDINELINKRERLAEELNKGKEIGGEEVNKLWEIVDAIKELEKAVIEYRKTSYYGTRNEETKNDTLKSKLMELFYRVSSWSDILDGVSEEVNNNFFKFLEKISRSKFSKKGVEEYLSSIVFDKKKMELFLQDLQTMQVIWDNDVKEVTVNLINSLEKETSELEDKYYKETLRRQNEEIDVPDSDTQLIHRVINLDEHFEEKKYEQELIAQQEIIAKVTNQIKEMERELQTLKESLDKDQAKLVENFIEANKKIIKNEEDNQARKEARELEKKLEGKGFSTENIEKIVLYCERLVDLEWKEEWVRENNSQRGIQTSIEIPPKK